MNITQLCSKAIISYLQGQSLTLVSNFYRGIEGSDTSVLTTEEGKKQLPCVIADCSNAEEGTIGSGNWWVDAVVKVQTNSDDKTETQHAAICAEVFGNFMVPTLAVGLSAFAGFTAQFILYQGQSSTIQDRHWESSLQLRIYCSPSDIL